MSAVADERFMQLALALGRRGLGNAWPNPAVGAVAASDGIVVGRGWTMPGGRPHAETEALRRAGAAARGATLYVTLEPCSHHGKTPPCTDAIVQAGIVRVVSALGDPNPKVAGNGFAQLRAAGIAVETGLGAEEAARAHAGHIRRVRDARPHVTLKLAVSADGKSALAERRRVQITGAAAQARVHLMRAMNDAVLIGIGTALADDPQLTCRLPGLAHRSPVRVVLDGTLRIPPDGLLVQGARIAPLWIVAGPQADAEAEARLRDRGAEVIRVAPAGGRLDLGDALRALALRGITRVLAEAGPKLAASLLAADLVDEAVLFRAPATLGPDAVDAVEGGTLDPIVRSERLKSCTTERVGDDTMETFERA